MPTSSAEYHAEETLHAISRRHDLSRNLTRIWVEKTEAGARDQDLSSAELLSPYEARIVVIERLVGRQTLEIEFLVEPQQLDQPAVQATWRESGCLRTARTRVLAAGRRAFRRARILRVLCVQPQRTAKIARRV